MLFEISHRLGDSLLERRPCDEAEALARPRDVQLPARLAVRLRLVPHEAPREPGRARDVVREVADADLDAVPQVDRVARVVALGGQQDAFGGVLDVEELARGRPVAPKHDLALPRLAR